MRCQLVQQINKFTHRDLFLNTLQEVSSQSENTLTNRMYTYHYLQHKSFVGVLGQDDCIGGFLTYILTESNYINSGLRPPTRYFSISTQRGRVVWVCFSSYNRSGKHQGCVLNLFLFISMYLVFAVHDWEIEFEPRSCHSQPCQS